MKPVPFIATLLLLAFTLGSCKKDSDFSSEEIQTATNQATLELYDNDVQNMVDEAAATGSLQTYKSDEEMVILTGCATITRDTSAFPHTLTIDFGTTNCTGNDGRSRRGKIIATYSGPYRDAGTVIQIGYDNYFVNDNQVSGSRTVTNTGLDSLGNPVFTVAANMQLNLANGAGTVTWTSNRVRTWISGYATSLRTDDIYSITGSATGVNAAGEEFEVNILQPLLRNLACRRHFTQGVLQMIRAGRPTRTIDYGNGTCDNSAVLTVNGRTRTIFFP